MSATPEPAEIAHSAGSRLRLKLTRRADAARLEELADRIADCDGVARVTIRPNTGSVIVEGAVPAATLAERLCSLHVALTQVIALYAPDQAAVEQTFVNKDAAGTLKLGQARGIALLVPAQAGLPVAEYAPNAVKKVVVGAGHADKRQVAYMVALQLPKAQVAGPDAADALAIALCHAHHARFSGRLEDALARAAGA